MINSREKAVVAAGLAMVLALPVAQGEERGEVEELGEIVVTAPRVEKELVRVPAGISVIEQDDIQLGRQQLGLDESLVRVPGLFFQNRYNFAQDLRISIRGFGARSNFGIRGIRIYADGIPLTLPDGQSNVDEIDLGSLERIEVIRGATSSLFGASAGGAIHLYTEDGPQVPFVSGQFAYGSYDYQNYQLKAGGQWDQLNYLVNVARLNLDGFRDHAAVESNNLNGKFRYDIDPSSSLTLLVNAVDQPISDDPGGLTAAELAGTSPTPAACRAAGFDAGSGRTAASCRNVAYDAGESVKQQKFGLVYRKTFGDKHELLLRNYYLWRDFQNKLPAGGPGLLGNSPSVNGLPNSAWVEFQRFFAGGGVQYIYMDTLFGRHNRFTVGFDIDAQEDDRQRYDNDLGSRGALRLDQTEQVLSRGLYVQNEFSLASNLELLAGARYDVIDYEVEDRFLADVTGDDSDSVDFDELSPMVGLVFSPLEAVNLYGNIATSFETPTTIEFANTAENGMAGGLNRALKPQTSVSYELGVKGLIGAWRLRYDLAVFHIDTDDEFVNVALVPAPIGRTFLENAAKTTRDGLEAAVAWQPGFVPGLTVSAAYTYSDFEYEDFTGSVGATAGMVFDGKKIPGVPENQFHGEITYFHPSGWYWGWDMLFVDSFYVDNANTLADQARPYQVANLRVGHLREIGNLEFHAFLGMNNMFDEEYNGNVRINAPGGRFYEPAPAQNVYGGLSVRYNFY